MKKILLITMLLFSTITNAMDEEEKQCLQGAFAGWSRAFVQYWEQVGVEMKKSDAGLYSEFQYLIKEQVNSNRMAQITLDHLLANHPDELRLDGKLHRLVPRYLNYQQEMHRELRKISEFDRLFLENQSYAHNIRKPDYDRLKQASQLIADIKSRPSVTALAREVMAKGEVLVSELACRP